MAVGFAHESISEHPNAYLWNSLNLLLHLSHSRETDFLAHYLKRSFKLVLELCGIVRLF